MANGSFSYKNEDPEKYLENSLEDFIEMNSLVDSFREDDGTLLPENEEIFFNFECHQFDDIEIKSNRD